MEMEIMETEMAEMAIVVNTGVSGVVSSAGGATVLTMGERPWC